MAVIDYKCMTVTMYMTVILCKYSVPDSYLVQVYRVNYSYLV